FDALAVPTVVMHKGSFDLGMMASLGFVPGPTRCTMLLSQLLYGVRRPSGFHTLAECAARELGVALPKELQRSDWSGGLSAEQLRYAARDAEVLLRLYQALDKKARDAGLQRVADIESRCLPALAWMTGAGAPFDLTAWQALAAEATAEATLLRGELDAVAPPN